MQVKLLDATPNAAATIGAMAAICYDGSTEPEASVRRAKQCKDKGHLATMRFAHATFNISGISRVCSHQLVRIAFAGILQKSQRYVKESAVTYVDPPALAGLSIDERDRWQMIQDEAEALYLYLVDNKLMKKEDARYILPQGCDTELNVCMNFQGWQTFLNLRADKHAQWEIREVAYEIQRQLHGVAPELFDMPEVV